MSTHPIDIVIPWVDGSDPVWQADHAKYRASKSADNHPARYREWGLFRYWFRGIEQNAPWVRKVHLLTYGHLPAWLEPDHPKLHIVNHRDFIPEEYLPTFSSHTIELNMHRIPDLAEHFLYFNDDVYLMKPSRPEDFFRGGLPCDTAVMGVIKNNDTANFMPYIMLNMMALVNMSFDKRSVIRQNFGKWFYPGYGKGLLYNLYLLPWGDFTGFRNYHSCVSFCKSTLEEVWDRFPEVLDATCRHKFRDRADVNQYLSLIHESDSALEYLISYFEKVDDPVEIVFFGDHQPSLSSSFYPYLNGKGLGGLTLSELENLYTVPFFIWTNYDSDKESVELTSLNYLSTLALERAGIALPAYNQFLADMMEEIPAINSRGFYSKSLGRFFHVEDAAGEDAKWLKNYEILQYNNMFDKRNKSELFFPYLKQ